jgi:hypothetical protein
MLGDAISQAVSRRLPTAAASGTGQVMWDFWWTKWHWGRFSLSTSVSPVNSHSTDYLSSGAGTIGQLVADVPSLTPPQEENVDCIELRQVMCSCSLGQLSGYIKEKKNVISWIIE